MKKKKRIAQGCTCHATLWPVHCARCQTQSFHGLTEDVLSVSVSRQKLEAPLDYLPSWLPPAVEGSKMAPSPPQDWSQAFSQQICHAVCVRLVRVNWPKIELDSMKLRWIESNLSAIIVPKFHFYVLHYVWPVNAKKDLTYQPAPVSWLNFIHLATLTTRTLSPF